MRFLLSLAAISVTLFAQDPNPATNPPVKLVRISALPESYVARKQMPLYPPDALGHRIQGLVRISVRIGSDGRIERASLISGHRLLAPAALQAVKQWTFQPAQVEGHAVRMISQITFSFTLDGMGHAAVQNVWPNI